MKLSKLFPLFFFLLITVSTFGQSNYLNIGENIHLLKDSLQSEKLISSFEKFLESADADNKDNRYVLPSQDIETFILLDEIWKIRFSKRNYEEIVYKPYLNNIVAIEDNKFLIQVSYISIKDNEAVHRASFSLIAHPTGNDFLYSSPLKRNTKNWKTYRAGNNVFFYKETINKENVDAYNSYAKLFDKKLNATNKTMDYYCCTDLPELLKLIGVDYKLDYNGREHSTFNSVIGDRKLIVSGKGDPEFNDFDVHDLWHSRLSLVKSRRAVNKHVDEACAYVYGGSWGISWEEIFLSFKEKVASDKTIDWTEIKEQKLDFGESPEKHLIADYVVTALIVEELEAKQGFSAVWKLLDCGVYEKGNRNYYTVLEELTGITKEEYNDYVWKLIKSK